jgi:hypothetical protein
LVIDFFSNSNNPCLSAGSAVTVLFIDYGNREETGVARLAQMPAGFEALPAQAHEYALAMVAPLGADEDDADAAVECFREMLELGGEPQFTINVEYKVSARRLGGGCGFYSAV